MVRTRPPAARTFAVPAALLLLALPAACAPVPGSGSMRAGASSSAVSPGHSPGHPPSPRSSSRAPEPSDPPSSQPPQAGAGGAEPSPAPAADPGAAGVDPLVAPARAALETLPVRPPGPMTGYNRKAFGQSWSDDVSVEGGHNGCDTRNDILGRDLVDITYKPGTRDCVVLTGRLVGPYSGRVLDFVRGTTTSSQVQIDHVVALGDAWRTGARQLDDDRRRDLANDPLELLAVEGGVNRAKSDSDASAWLPPRREYHCPYVARQVLVKQRYGLWATPPEAQAMRSVLDAC